MLEILMTLTLVALVFGTALPQLLSARERMRTVAAARYLASRMALARTEAAARGASVALRFQDGPLGVAFAVYQDGNRNGVLAGDIADGTDRLVHPAVRLGDEFPGVRIALAPDTPAEEAVQLGRSDILSFSPDGTSTSGTIHVLGSDGVQWGVRVLGATGRTRVLRYDAAARTWVEPF
jgi:Tfp pilus assembly protein FimT